MNFCPLCGAALEQGAEFCIKCGYKPDIGRQDTQPLPAYQNPENLSLYEDMAQLSMYQDPAYRPPRRTPIYDTPQHYGQDRQTSVFARLPKYTKTIIGIAAAAVLLAVMLAVLFTVYLRPSAPPHGGDELHRLPTPGENNLPVHDEITDVPAEQQEQPDIPDPPAEPETYESINFTLIAYGYTSDGGGSGAAAPSDTDSQSLTPSVSLSSTLVDIDGYTAELETFYMNDRDYFKLRGVARMLNGSGKQFDITFRRAGREFTLYKGKAYTPTGGAYMLPAGETPVIPEQWRAHLGGSQRTILAYLIGNEHFFSIDDLMLMLDISAQYERPEPDGWFQENGKWYYTKPDGTWARDEWQQIQGNWYYFYSDGSMATGWLQLGRNWYYLRQNGVMAENESLTIGGVRYNFDESGVCTNP